MDEIIDSNSKNIGYTVKKKRAVQAFKKNQELLMILPTKFMWTVS